MAIRPLATVPSALLYSRAAGQHTRPLAVQLAASHLSIVLSAPKQSLPYPVMKLSELLEEWIRYRILSRAAAASETGRGDPHGKESQCL